MAERNLRTALAEESRAYGFTLAFWGSGALLVNEFGLPSLPLVLLYAGGALIGFGIMALLAYRTALGSISERKGEDFLVLSMVHFVASLAPVVITGLAALRLPAGQAFLAAGVTVSVVYNLSIPLEDRIYRRAMKLERALLRL